MLAQDLMVAIEIDNKSWMDEDREDRRLDLQELDETLQHLVDNDYKILNALELKQVLTSWEIEIGSSISRGGCGEVLKATWLGHTIVAVKRLHMLLETQKRKEDFLREVKTWFSLRHPHIVPLLGACATGRPFMVAPYTARGHALQYLESVERRDLQVKGVKLLYEVSLGMQYLHARGVVHGDLKAVNILIDEYETSYVTDFGFATLKQFSSTRNTATSTPAVGGTLRWMSPERLQGAKLTPPVDVYAYAMTAYQVLSEGDVPFTETPDALLYQLVVNAHLRPQRPAGDGFMGVGDGLWRLMSGCWAPDPLARPSFSAVSVVMKSLLRDAQSCASAVAVNIVTGGVVVKGAVGKVEPVEDSGIATMSAESPPELQQAGSSYVDVFRGIKKDKMKMKKEGHKQLEIREIRLRKKELELAAQKGSLRDFSDGEGVSTFNLQLLNEELEDEKLKLKEAVQAVSAKEREIKNQQLAFEQGLRLHEQERRVHQKKTEQHASRSQRSETRDRVKEEAAKRKEELDSRSKATGSGSSNGGCSASPGGFAGFLGTFFGTPWKDQAPLDRSSTEDSHQSNPPPYSSRIKELPEPPAPAAPPVSPKNPSYQGSQPSLTDALPTSADPTSAAPHFVVPISGLPTSSNLALPSLSTSRASPAGRKPRKPFVIRFF
ncbi:UNVERIFIED_CONTAM: hypothetical protein HDU68_000813 [Siphonaria sp. JEL0065]|nr:hypothetical protein HDU68_000813 [Siphonaria sp. JEL0065]